MKYNELRKIPVSEIETSFAESLQQLIGDDRKFEVYIDSIHYEELKTGASMNLKVVDIGVYDWLGKLQPKAENNETD